MAEPWVAPLEAGDPEAAWDLFIERYRRLIFGAIRRYTAEPDDVMDVFAHVCEAVRKDDYALAWQDSFFVRQVARFHSLSPANRQAKVAADSVRLVGNAALIAHLEGGRDARIGIAEGGLARLEGGLLARIGMAEGRLARLTLTFWVATLGTLVALLKL